MLRELGIPFQACNPGIPETLNRKISPEEMARELSVQKTKACRRQGKLTVGMDTLVVVGKNILGKPKDSADAEEMLKTLSNRRHRVITGIALLYGNRLVKDAETTWVRFRNIEAEEIRWYIDSKEPFDKAGAYAIQGLGRIFIQEIHGCYYNVVGFPLGCFQRLLGRLGFALKDLIPDI